MVEDGAEELEDLVHFSVSELPSRGYGVMEEIRRQGKLCDVTLKDVSICEGPCLKNKTMQRSLCSCFPPG
ncbi:hypothetical protein FD754_008208 [Muntiacus muntjak]|uniref:Uncharacterized protein n=1 Tax=Muntiacus muntjak TaxID=9888 RepID=A0A5N3WQF9_MUNMU|nr:hypothetical protein FD754_008208 [Muntiacus muntjak]